MSKQQYFHLTLGPVQGFVAQARRTRDFWAGSFLLSWMSSVAMVSVQKQDGEIKFPIPDDDFMKALKGELNENLPQQGSVPNRFKAMEVKVNQHFDPQQVVNDMQSAWIGLCQHIWQQDIVQAGLSSEQLQISKTIWQRQLKHYWEINWCLTEEESASNLLDRRKNWRSHTLPAEPGVKCMMMEGFQELSGLAFPDQAKLDKFWQQIRGEIKSGKTDLRPGECLSALGFVKRRFVRHFENFTFMLTSGQSINGWKLPSQVPSVAHIAAAPWYAEVLEQSKTDDSVNQSLSCFYDEAEQLVDFNEMATPIQRVKQALADHRDYHGEWAGLDGNVFHLSQLENYKLFGDEPDVKARAEATKQALNQLRKSANLPEASSFYAVLIMDGDSLGSQMSDREKQEPISRGLNNFTKGVKPIVERNDGFLVYAGGDDVLALVCLDRAVPLALELRNFYASCFAEQNQELAANKSITTSLSGAIQFCHIKTPLTFVLNDAHSLLDDIAKDQTGRDSLAVRVWKPGGLHLQWSQPWQYLIENAQATSNLLSDVVKLFSERELISPFTNKFIFKAEETLERLPQSLSDSDDCLMKTLLQAELVHSGLDLKQTKEKQQLLDTLLAPLLALATPYKRITHDNGTVKALVSQNRFNGDALKLVRFLTAETVTTANKKDKEMTL